MKLLFEIENVFDIDGRGCVLVPGIPERFRSTVKTGSRILIVTPQGEHLRTSIADFEMVSRGRVRAHAPFAVHRTVRKSHLPVGSKVYLPEVTAG